MQGFASFDKELIYLFEGLKLITQLIRGISQDNILLEHIQADVICLTRADTA